MRGPTAQPKFMIEKGNIILNTITNTQYGSTEKWYTENYVHKLYGVLNV